MPISNPKEEIDPRVLNLIGIDDIFDLDYDTYLTLLKEAMVRGRMTNQSIPTEELMLLTEEYKKVKGKKNEGRFEVKKKKLSTSSFGIGELRGKLIGEKPVKGFLPAETIAKSPLSQSLESNISAITSSVISIHETLKKQQKVSDANSDYERRKNEKEKRALQESNLEKRFKGLKKVAEKIISPVKSLLDRILQFFTNVILGRIVYKLIEWMGDPKNANKVKTIIRFLKDWGPALISGFILFGTRFGKGVRILTRIALSAIGKLAKAVPALLRFTKSNPKTALAIAGGTYAATQLTQRAFSGGETKQQAFSGGGTVNILKFSGGGFNFGNMFSGFNFGNMFSGFVSGEKGVDKIPAWLSDGEFVMSRGAVAKYGVDTLETMNAAGGGTNKPKVVSGATYAAGGGLIGDIPYLSAGQASEQTMQNLSKSMSRKIGMSADELYKSFKTSGIPDFQRILGTTEYNNVMGGAYSADSVNENAVLKKMYDIIKGPQSFTQSSRVAAGLDDLAKKFDIDAKTAPRYAENLPKLNRPKPRITRIDPSRMLPSAGQSSANAMRAAQRATRSSIPPSRAIVPYSGGLSELPIQQIYTNMNVPGGAKRAALMRLLNNPATRMAGRASSVLNAPVIGDMILPEGTSDYDQRTSAYSDPRLSPYQRRIMMESVGLRGGAIKGGYGLNNQSFKDAPKTQIMSDDNGKPFIGYKALRNGRLTYLRGPQKAGAGTSNIWENLGRMINPGAYKDIDEANARKKYDEASRGSIASLKARGASKVTIAKRQEELKKRRPPGPPVKLRRTKADLMGGGSNSRPGRGRVSTQRVPAFSASTKGSRPKINLFGIHI